MIAIQIVAIIFIAALLIRFADVILAIFFATAVIGVAVIVAWAIVQVLWGVLV